MATGWLTSDFGIFQISVGPLGLRRLRLWEGGIPTRQARAERAEAELLRSTQTQLQAYFAGQLTHFDLPLDWSEASDFYRQVWEELCKIPYGRTTSYQYIAEQLGDKNAIRAVGQANARNPIAIVVPCHRVIAKSGDLQGYVYGLDFKRRLLALENPASFGEQGVLF